MAAPGAFASCNPRAVTLAGVSAFRAGPDGLTVGVFGWGDGDTHLATNTRTADHQVLGFVIPGNGTFYTFRRAYVRAGYQATLMAKGDFWARFAGGAQIGAQVYASLVDGAALSGYAADAEATPWYVVTDAAPGEIAIISTWSKPPA